MREMRFLFKSDSISDPKFDHVGCPTAIVGLAGRKLEDDLQADRISQCMDIDSQAAAE